MENRRLETIQDKHKNVTLSVIMCVCVFACISQCLLDLPPTWLCTTKPPRVWTPGGIHLRAACRTTGSLMSPHLEAGARLWVFHSATEPMSLQYSTALCINPTLRAMTAVSLSNASGHSGIAKRLSLTAAKEYKEISHGNSYWNTSKHEREVYFEWASLSSIWSISRQKSNTPQKRPKQVKCKESSLLRSLFWTFND